MKRQPEGTEYYKIGEVSELFHIGVDSIRYYEKVGLLHPVRSAENHYRLYSLDDIRTMNTIRELLDLGFSTEEILAFENDRTLDHVTAMLKQEEAVIDREMKELRRKKKEIHGRLLSIRENLARDCSGEINLLELPARNCFMISRSDMPDQMINYQLARFTVDLKKKMATIGACDCYTLDIHSLNDTCQDYRTKNVFFYSEHLELETNYTLPAGIYLSTCYRGGCSHTREVVPRMLRYAQNHRFQVMGDPIEFCHIDRYETALQSEYLTEIQLLVAKESTRSWRIR